MSYEYDGFGRVREDRGRWRLVVMEDFDPKEFSQVKVELGFSEEEPTAVWSWRFFGIQEMANAGAFFLDAVDEDYEDYEDDGDDGDEFFDFSGCYLADGICCIDPDCARDGCMLGLDEDMFPRR